MSDEQDNGDIRKGIKLDEEGHCIACHGTEEVETSEGWNLGCSYCSTALDKANAHIAKLTERVGELEAALDKIAGAVRWGIDYRYIARDALGDDQASDLTYPRGMAFDKNGDPVTDYGPEHDQELLKEQL